MFTLIFFSLWFKSVQKASGTKEERVCLSYCAIMHKHDDAFSFADIKFKLIPRDCRSTEEAKEVVDGFEKIGFGISKVLRCNGLASLCDMVVA